MLKCRKLYHVCSSVVRLALVTGYSSKGGEHHEELHIWVIEDSIQIVRASHLWSHHFFKVFNCHVSKKSISENHSAVHDSPYGWKTASNVCFELVDSLQVGHIQLHDPYSCTHGFKLRHPGWRHYRIPVTY